MSVTARPVVVPLECQPRLTLIFAIDNMSVMVMATRDASERLGVSPRRVHGLIRSGQLRATSVGGRYLIDEESIDLLSARLRRRGARPFSRRVAWAAAGLADRVDVSWLSSSERSRLRARLRGDDLDVDAWVARLRSRAAAEHSFRVGTDHVVDLLDSGVVGRSGVHARDLATDRLVGSERVIVWVPDDEHLRDVVARFDLLPTSRGNLTIKVAGVHGLGSVGTGRGDAFRLIVAADLLDLADARSRQAGGALVRRCLSEVGGRVVG
jgi:excisionase family DNA binding protein